MLKIVIVGTCCYNSVFISFDWASLSAPCATYLCMTKQQTESGSTWHDLIANYEAMKIFPKKKKSSNKQVRGATISLFFSSSITGTMRAETIPLLMLRMLTGSLSSGYSLTSVCPSTVIFRVFLLTWTDHHLQPAIQVTL